MAIKDQLVRRIAEPAFIRYYQWRGDPVARLLSRRTWADPYPLYAEVRRQELGRGKLGVAVTARHAMAERILRDRRFSASPEHQAGYQPPVYPDDDPRHGLPPADLLTLDPPDHTRIRRLVSGAFSPKAVAALDPWIAETADRLLDQPSRDGDGFDLIDTLAFPLPMAVICRLLGVPVDDQDKFRVWGHDVAATLDPRLSQGATAQQQASVRALTAYLRDLVARRRADPDDSILSALIAAEEEGERLSSGELVNTALLLLVAGFETTVNLIGNGTVALLTQRDQWERLRDEPALIPAAVEELLRYDSPAQLTQRVAAEDVEIDGTAFKKGSPVLILLGGANRDPAVFDQPDRLRVDRPEASRHLAFSLGMHHCLGAVLARLEGRIAFTGLIRHCPGLELAGTPARRPQLVLRGYESVPVRARARVTR